MERNENKDVDGWMENIFMQTIEQDLHAFQSGKQNAHATNKKLLLLHLFIQMYADKTTPVSQTSSNHIEEVTQKIDNLQQQADTFLNEMEQNL